MYVFRCSRAQRRRFAHEAKTGGAREIGGLPERTRQREGQMQLEKLRAERAEQAERKRRAATATNPATERLWRDAQRKQEEVPPAAVPETHGWK